MTRPLRLPRAALRDAAAPWLELPATDDSATCVPLEPADGREGACLLHRRHSHCHPSLVSGCALDCGYDSSTRSVTAPARRVARAKGRRTRVSLAARAMARRTVKWRIQLLLSLLRKDARVEARSATRERRRRQRWAASRGVSLHSPASDGELDSTDSESSGRRVCTWRKRGVWLPTASGIPRLSSPDRFALFPRLHSCTDGWIELPLKHAAHSDSAAPGAIPPIPLHRTCNGPAVVCVVTVPSIFARPGVLLCARGFTHSAIPMSSSCAVSRCCMLPVVAELSIRSTIAKRIAPSCASPATACSAYRREDSRSDAILPPRHPPHAGGLAVVTTVRGPSVRRSPRSPRAVGVDRALWCCCV